MSRGVERDHTRRRRPFQIGTARIFVAIGRLPLAGAGPKPETEREPPGMQPNGGIAFT